MASALTDSECLICHDEADNPRFCHKCNAEYCRSCIKIWHAEDDSDQSTSPLLMPFSGFSSPSGPSTSAAASATSGSSTSAISGASSLSPGVSARRRRCPHCNQKTKLDQYYRSPKMENLRRELKKMEAKIREAESQSSLRCAALERSVKEKDDQLIKMEKRIADQCEIHNLQKIFFCRSCDTTGCRMCRSCCVNPKDFIEDAKDDCQRQLQVVEEKIDQVEASRQQIRQYDEDVKIFRLETHAKIDADAEDQKRGIDEEAERIKAAFDDMLQRKTSSASAIEEDLCLFDAATEEDIDVVKKAGQSEFLNRIVEKRDVIAKVSHEAYILLDKFDNADFAVPALRVQSSRHWWTNVVLEGDFEDDDSDDEETTNDDSNGQTNEQVNGDENEDARASEASGSGEGVGVGIKRKMDPLAAQSPNYFPPPDYLDKIPRLENIGSE